MGKLLVLTSCCFLLAASQSSYPEHLETNLLSFREEPKAGHIEAFQDHYVKQIFAKLLRRRLPNMPETVEPIKVENPESDDIEEPTSSGSVPEVMLLHSQLQNKLGWGSDDSGGNRNRIVVLNNPPNGFNQNQPSQSYGGPPPPPPQNGQSYGPPPPLRNNQNNQYGPPPNQNNQYGPPPNQKNQYGPPPNQNNQYGPPPNQKNQYGPPPNQNNQYGPPPNQNNQYGPPPNQNNQEFGPPTPVRQINQEYGGPPPPPPPQDSFQNNNGQQGYQPNQEYGAPQGNGGGNQNDLRVNQGNFGGYIQNSDNKGSLNQQSAALGQFSDNAPAPPQLPPTEIELPSPPERKTLVYVLVKKPQKQPEIRIRKPAPTQVSKPEVYFVKYKTPNQGGNNSPIENEAQELLSQVGGGDIGVGRFNGGYSDAVSMEPQSLQEAGRIAEPAGKTRESVGYPNTEYRAPPSMLNPNQEPMSISVYDRVRNGVPASSGGTASASTRAQQPQQGSHYRAPGSQPFDFPSGKMVSGRYIGMTSLTSNSLSNQYYA
ncbi:hypothetical protein Ocin01_05564 [Orchesella cincta]|uniref:DUF243 domain-containing protein n=1 Tax=Orchesella cincta TaxID=48709 RepID=A0A1D2N783_ORCCI|nr:hypothetical protein Ocin01_05564 [Orchesella cincta]